MSDYRLSTSFDAEFSLRSNVIRKFSSLQCSSYGRYLVRQKLALLEQCEVVSYALSFRTVVGD